MEGPRGANPAVSNYRGVTASRQQQSALRSPSYPNLGSALAPPSPHFAATYRSRSPSRPAISSHQSNPQLRTRPVANHTRPNSAILLSSSRNAAVEQNASAMSAVRHHGQTQERPVSLHAALPSTVDRAMMDSVHQQQEIPLEIPRKSSQRPKPSQKPKRPSKAIPQPAPSPEEKESQEQMAQKGPSPEQQSPRPIPQISPSLEQKELRGRVAQRATSPEQEKSSTQIPQKAQIPEQLQYQLPQMWFEQPSRERVPERPQYRDQSTQERPQYRDQSTQTEEKAPRDLCAECHCHQTPPTSEIPQRMSETPERIYYQQSSRQAKERAQTIEHDRIPQPKAETPEHHRQEKLPSKQTPQQKIQTPESSHRHRLSTLITPSDQTPEHVESQQPRTHVIAPTPDRSALLNRQQGVLMQPPRRVSQLPAQPSPWNDHQQSQHSPRNDHHQPQYSPRNDHHQLQHSPRNDHQQPQNSPRNDHQQPQPSPWNDHQQPQHSPTSSMGSAAVFRNSATPTSPRHSRHDSFNSVISDHSSQSRRLSAFSPASSSLDVKETHPRNHGEDHISSPLALQWERPDSNSRPNSVVCESPAEEDFPKVSKKLVKKERRSSGFQRFISIGSMEKPGIFSDEKDAEKTIPDQKASDEDTKFRDNGRHKIYGPSTFSHSVDNLSASFGTSMLQKVGNKMKRKSQGLSGLLRPKSVAVSSSSPANDGQQSGLMAASEKQNSPLFSTANSKTNLSRDDIYLFTNTSEPLLNLNKNRESVQEPDIIPTPQPAAPRGILNQRNASKSYPTADFSGTEEAECSPSPVSIAPVTPSDAVQYILGHSVNPFETTDIETLMDVFSHTSIYPESSDSNHKVTRPQSMISPAGVLSIR